MYRFFIILLITCCSVPASLYELKLTFEPKSAGINMSLRNPLQSGDRTNLYRSMDCGVLTPHPEWGVQDYEEDNPLLQVDSIQGGRLITSDELLDPGDAGLLVFSTAGAATCTLHIISWPGVEPQTFTGYVRQGGGVWFVTNLPCAVNMGFKILKARQNIRGGRWLWVKIIAEFDEPLQLNEITNSFHSSIKNERWIIYHYGDNIKVNRQRTVARFGGTDKAIVKSKKNKNYIKLYGHALENFQSESIPVFINVNNYSGYQVIPFDEHNKYKAPKE